MFGFKEILQKLNLMSGAIYNTEGIVKRIRITQKDDSVVILKIYELLKSPAPVNKSSFYFSKIQIDNIIIEGRIEKITMNEFQQVSATYEALKRDGTPAKVENPRLETDHPELIVGTIDEAAQRITLKPIKGAVKEDTAIAVKLIADAIVGEGEEDLEIVGSLMLTPGRAEKLTFNFEEPVDLVE